MKLLPEIYRLDFINMLQRAIKETEEQKTEIIAHHGKNTEEEIWANSYINFLSVLIEEQKDIHEVFIKESYDILNNEEVREIYPKLYEEVLNFHKMSYEDKYTLSREAYEEYQDYLNNPVIPFIIRHLNDKKE